MENLLERFGRSDKAVSRYVQFFQNKKILVEREVILPDLERYRIKDIFKKYGLKWLTVSPTPAVVNLAKEFYSLIPHIESVSSCNQFLITLREIPLTFSENLI